jgi:hypothetical protein
MLTFLVSHVFSSTELEKKRAEQVLPGSTGWGVVAQTMYTHGSKYKNEKNKKFFLKRNVSEFHF